MQYQVKLTRESSHDVLFESERMCWLDAFLQSTSTVNLNKVQIFFWMKRKKGWRSGHHALHAHGVLLEVYRSNRMLSCVSWFKIGCEYVSCEVSVSSGGFHVKFVSVSPGEENKMWNLSFVLFKRPFVFVFVLHFVGI
jgi:hypothetical protein